MAEPGIHPRFAQKIAEQRSIQTGSEASIPIVDQAITLVRNIDAGLADALERSRLEGAIPNANETRNSYEFFDAWLQQFPRGQLIGSQQPSLQGDTYVSTEKWSVQTQSAENPRVLWRFTYVTSDMKEGYAYFIRPAETMVIDNAIGYQAEGFGQERIWHQTDISAAIAPQQYLQVLLNSYVRTVDIAGYLIDFPSGGGGLPLPTPELLAA